MSHDTLTPPPAATPDAPTPRSGSSAPRVLSILLVVFGVIVIAATVLNGVLGTFDGAARQEQTQTAAVDGVTRLEVDASRTDLAVVFDDVDVATLDTVDTGRADWTLERDGDRLRVASPHRSWFSWVGFREAGHATLTLPQRLSGIDATMSLAGGSLQATGTFGELTLDLAAGALTVTGDARTLDTTVSAGSADLSLADVREATLSLAAGELVGRLTGSAPERTAITVSAGSLELSLPDVAYAVRSDVSAGSLDDSRLTTASTSPRTISVEVSAGSATLLGRG